MDFAVNVDVVRLCDEQNTEHIVGFVADIKITCAGCGHPFEFIGIPAGIANAQPRVSADGTELRAPIRPSNDPVEAVKVLLK